MKSMLFLSVIIAPLSFTVSLAQTDEGVIEVIDRLTIEWDEEALKLETFEGMQEFCHNQQHRTNTIDLINSIHYYDSILYETVKEKYSQTGGQEAQDVIKDIEKLESDYTTKSFKQFLHKECNTIVSIERNYGENKGKQYAKEVKSFEKEIVKYVEEVTNQIDIIDEHVHHL